MYKVNPVRVLFTKFGLILGVIISYDRISMREQVLSKYWTYIGF